LVYGTIEEMFDEMKKIAEEEGYRFNPNKVELQDILQACGTTNIATVIHPAPAVSEAVSLPMIWI